MEQVTLDEVSDAIALVTLDKHKPYNIVYVYNILYGLCTYYILGPEHDVLIETLEGVLSIEERSGFSYETRILYEDALVTTYHYGFYRFKFNPDDKTVKVYKIMCYCNTINQIIPLINTQKEFDINRYTTIYGYFRIDYMYGIFDYFLSKKNIKKQNIKMDVPIFYKELACDKDICIIENGTLVFVPVLIDTNKGSLFGMKYMLHLFGGYTPIIETFYKYLSTYNISDIYDIYNPKLEYFESSIITLPMDCNSIDMLHILYKEGIVNAGYYSDDGVLILTEEAYESDNMQYSDIFGSISDMIEGRDEQVSDFFL